MDEPLFRMRLYLPAQAATETEATILQWRVVEGAAFRKGESLAEIDSAKSVYEFEAPCDGRVVRVLRGAGETVALVDPVIEIETSDAGMRDWIPPAAVADQPAARPQPARAETPTRATTAALTGLGGYLPERLVTNAELVRNFPGISEEYVFQVTGIRQRRWAADGEKPSDMAFRAATEAIRDSGLPREAIDAVIVATTTPDVAMPSTACILQNRLGLAGVPAFDVNAACSGWLYAVSLAQCMILAGNARNVLAVGADLQSRLLDPADPSAFFIFGDGAGAAVVSGGGAERRLRQVVLGADTSGLHLARRLQPLYVVADPAGTVDPWIRLEGPGLFRAAAENFAELVRRTIERAGWLNEEVRWVVPHQANGRILRAAAKRSGIPFERFYLNVERVGNTSSASIPLALVELGRELRRGDKLVLCSVGAGLTTAAVALEW